jgi:hypothetical protein
MEIDSKCIFVLTSGEKTVNVRVTACCNDSKCIFVLTSGEKTVNVRVTACCNDSRHFLHPIWIFKGVNKKEKLPDGLPSRTHVYTNRKSLYISTDVFSKSLKENFLQYKPSRKVILSLDGSRVQCSYILLLQTTIENNKFSFVYQVTLLATYRLRTTNFLGT